eukprot:347207-Chlamydomonas_euryale.AAC.1
MNEARYELASLSAQLTQWNYITNLSQQSRTPERQTFYSAFDSAKGSCMFISLNLAAGAASDFCTRQISAASRK